MTNVKSPYNFVPLNKKVFLPEWAKYANQDIPFDKALTGKITLKIKAKTPIFIRGEGVAKTATVDNKTIPYTKYCFFKHKDTYCIPGTSIKGELANVLEIMSFGKLKQVNDSKYSIRDFGNNYLYPKNIFRNVLGGFLQYKDGKYFINYNNEKPGRITHEQIDKDFEKSFVEKFKYEEDENGRKIKKSLDKNATNKYQLFKPTDLNQNFEYHYDSRGRQVYKKGGNKKGILVFTGQSSLRKIWDNQFDKGGNTKGSGKHMEFIFWKADKPTVVVEKQVIEDFFFAYFEHDKKNQSKDWKFWKPKLDRGEQIPVFFTLQNGSVKHLGLSQLYKLPYEHRVKDLINEEHKTKALDLTETVFGTVEEDGTYALKGRVSIEPALCTNTATEKPMVTTTLGSPKASYYPFYLEQNVGNNNGIRGNYKTYNDDTIIAGRKRYAVKTGVDVNDTNSENIGKTTVSFCPLEEGVEFETTIHYHNLRPVELGALLSALTFHNTPEAHHSLGMAKPLGYGNVVFEISSDDFGENEKLEYMCMFEKLMEGFTGNRWLISTQLKELCTLAKPIDNKTYLKYMELADFANLKKEKKALPYYSSFVNNGLAIRPNSIDATVCNFDYKVDKNKYINANIRIDNDGLKQYIKAKKDELVYKIEIAQKTIKDKLEEKNNIKRNLAKEEYKKKGITLLLEQNSIDELISKTKTWESKYYTKNERKEIKLLIPVEYIDQFIEHIQTIYEKKKTNKIWKHKKDITKSNGYKYLIRCIGETKTKDWFKKNNLITE